MDEKHKNNILNMLRKINDELGNIFIKEILYLQLGKCPICGETPRMEDFRDEASKREYETSGICQFCQDKIFGGDSSDYFEIDICLN